MLVYSVCCKYCKYYNLENVIYNDMGDPCCKITHYEFSEDYSPKWTCPSYVSAKVTSDASGITPSKAEQSKEDEPVIYAEYIDDDGNSVWHEVEKTGKKREKAPEFSPRVKSALHALLGICILYGLVSSISFSDVMNFIGLGLILLFGAAFLGFFF